MRIAALFVLALTLAACMPERAYVMRAAENQANRYARPLGCGLGGEQSKYLGKHGKTHDVLVCGIPMVCKKDDVATADGYTCVAQNQAPASWR